MSSSSAGNILFKLIKSFLFLFQVLRLGRAPFCPREAFGGLWPEGSLQQSKVTARPATGGPDPGGSELAAFVSLHPSPRLPKVKWSPRESQSLEDMKLLISFNKTLSVCTI